MTRVAALLSQFREGTFYDFRVHRAHQEALMEDAERSAAPNGFRVGSWVLWIDREGKKHWLYSPEDA